jgi:hypothetical protein
MQFIPTPDRESHFEDISADLLSHRGIPTPEKIEVAPSI